MMRQVGLLGVSIGLLGKPLPDQPQNNEIIRLKEQ
jgi:hypothetical protein